MGSDQDLRSTWWWFQGFSSCHSEATAYPETSLMKAFSHFFLYGLSTVCISNENAVHFSVPDLWWCFLFLLHSTRTPAQTRVCSHFLNLRTFSWQHRLSSMTSAETWDNWGEIWQVCNVCTTIFICSGYTSQKHSLRVMRVNENTLSFHDIRWWHISFPPSSQAAIICIRVDWLSGIVSLWSFCCACLFESLNQPFVTLSLWFLEVPTDQTSAQSGIIFP